MKTQPLSFVSVRRALDTRSRCVSGRARNRRSRGNTLGHTGDSPGMLPASVRSLDLVPVTAVLRGASPAWAAFDTCAGPAAGTPFDRLN